MGRSSVRPSVDNWLRNVIGSSNDPPVGPACNDADDLAEDRPHQHRHRPMSFGGQERYERLRREHRWVVPERYNIAAEICDRQHPDALAMVHERHDGIVRALHWGDIQALANRAANLLAGHGVEPGDRVAVVLPPTPETAAIFFATWKLGAILLSMSVLYGDEGIAHRLSDSQPAPGRVRARPAKDAHRQDPPHRAARARGPRPISAVAPWSLLLSSAAAERP
jgi:non-ribosomal peptide synthetase component F